MILQVGKTYEIPYAKQDAEKLTVIDEYRHHYLCVHDTPFGDQYTTCINKNSLVCAGNQGEMPIPREVRH